MLLYVLGGPIMSLLIGLAGLAALLVGVNGPFWAHPALELIGFGSLGLFLATIIPMRTSGFMTDGAQAKLYLRGGDEAKARMTILQLTARSYSGERPRDWPEHLIDELGEFAHDPLTRYSNLIYRYVHAFDLRRYEDAENALKSLRSLRDDLPAAVADTIDQESAWHHAAVYHDPVAAERHLSGRSGRGPSPLDPLVWWRLQVILNCLHGSTAALERAQKSFEIHLNRSPDRGLAVAQLDWVEDALLSIQHEGPANTIKQQTEEYR
jgi:uncharacterized membrane protein YccC